MPAVEFTGIQSGIAMCCCPASIEVMKSTDLALSRVLGIVEAPPDAEHVLELPFTPAVQNHLGTVHAAVQFALAEAASAERLQRDFGACLPNEPIMPVVRGSEVKYRHAATGDLLAFAQPDALTRQHLANDLQKRSRSSATVLVELKDRSGQTTFTGRFEWLIAKITTP